MARLEAAAMHARPAAAGRPTQRSKRIGLAIAGLALLAALAPPRPALAADDEALGFERTPPRLSLVDGDVSFYRPGASEWSEAAVNTPLATGDELYAADDANLELQVGPRGYVRAGEDTQLALASLEPDFLQFRVSEGRASLDLRSLSAGQTYEVDTPNAAFTIERSGYYRVEVDGDTTTFISRRGGRASVTPAVGPTKTIAASEEVVIRGLEAPHLETYAAPELDGWDRWNYARTDDQLDAVSARYVPSSIYGVDDLDDYGDWRVVPTYGAIWIPRGVAVGWAPYTTGRWIWDPYYGWTWVDTAPWGWAPYHYGRWVFVSGLWAWAPGPLVVRAYYAPALVAFFGGGGVSVSVSIAPPLIGWVALGWGEPIVPWWGPRGCRGVPHWAGWGGPRVVNEVVIAKTTVVRTRDIRVYENERVRDAFVAVDRDRFGRRRGPDVKETRLPPAEVRRLRRLGGDLDVRPAPASLAPSGREGRRPPRAWEERSVVATRAPRPAPEPPLEAERTQRGGRGEPTRAEARQERSVAEPRVRIVEPSRESPRQRTFERPPFATRGEGERGAPPPPPRYRQEREPEATGRAPTPAPAPERARRERAAPATPGTSTRPAPPRESAPRASQGQERRRELPGEPASRVYRRRDSGPREGAAPAPSVRQRGDAGPSAGRAPQRGNGGDEARGHGGNGARSRHR